ncbi:Bifunctional DNA N-glycosylase DNA-(apurinic or apyrimidinic site) lyase [Hyphodiscus hymeniophilus]|uniref:Endonuclease III homolog n=1 Tax=Hyphodiscus hymeniophilus TaxID=353542 RepID=A0A9P7B0J3_9HELO|nr:Bifunctional DNA N-glycosylase DNA-(apurinic or apyrimidinic site) lyase [Hyphodiscus hymeniophilus]
MLSFRGGSLSEQPKTTWNLYECRVVDVFDFGLGIQGVDSLSTEDGDLNFQHSTSPQTLQLELHTFTMRTSRISQDTSKMINATSPSKRSTRSSLQRFAHNGHAPTKAEESPQYTDIEDAVSSRKRKREVTTRTPIKRSPQKNVTIKTEVEDTISFSPTADRKIRKPARQVKNEDTGEVEIHPPNDWAEVYAAVMEMRTKGTAQNAVVDTMGCERLGLDTVTPKVKPLMLSSQTKDTTTAQVMARLQKDLPPYKKGDPVGLNLENILAVEPTMLNELIWAVGFHNNKTKYIKATAEILRDRFDGDIPDTIEGLMSLPGVGPKMSYLCMSTSWGRHEGIGVDVHVHRITNLWGWHKTKGPEETRLALQAWLPKELWHEINWLLVGFGQTVCLPVGRKCGDCELGLNGLCKAAERSKVNIGRKIKEEKIKMDNEGHITEKTETVKQEVLTQDIAVNAHPDQEVLVEGGLPEFLVEEGLTKEEERVVMDEIANSPGTFSKKRKEQ